MKQLVGGLVAIIRYRDVPSFSYAGGGHWGHVPSPTKDEKGKNREKEIKNKLKRKKPLFVPESLKNLTCCPRVSSKRWVRHCAALSIFLENFFDPSLFVFHPGLLKFFLLRFCYIIYPHLPGQNPKYVVDRSV